MATPLAAGFRFSGQAQHKLTYAQVKRLAQGFGLPGDAIAQIAKGESGLYADVQQRDPGDRMVGYGLLQMTPNAWGQGSAAYRKMQSLGGVAAMRDPVKNMEMARFLYKAAGNKLTPWYGTRYLTNRAGEGTLGPVRPGLVGGAATTAPAVAGTPTRGGGGTTITTSTPGIDNRAARYQLVRSFLSGPSSGSSYDPVGFATQFKGLADIPATTRTRTIAGGVTSGGGQQAPNTVHPASLHGPLHFDGKAVAAWIHPVLNYARQQGWKGTVNSGYRSVADQSKLYNDMLAGRRAGPVAKPGTSNHNFTAFPGGAVDVSDPAQLSAILKRSKYRNLLVWAGAKDPVHFSHPHRGSY